jgi:hypothetical protein
VIESTTRKHYEALRPHGPRQTAVAFWIAAAASPKEIATRATDTSVVPVLDRYGHLLPGIEDRVTDALDALAESVSRDGPGVEPVASLARGHAQSL